MSLGLQFVTHSEIGLVRKNNQDSGFASQYLLLVADGMGGAAAGDLASAVAVDTIRSVDGPPDGPAMLSVLAGAIREANDRIADLVDDDPALEGMGTTVTGALFDGSQLGLAHIGDSRAYLLRDGRLERLTHDHSWVQSLVDDGKISTDEAAVHPHRSLLLKVLNGQPSNDPDLTSVPVRPGDRLLFCSDGVCGLVDDPEIAAAMRIDNLAEASARLVELAHAAGGIDNITVVLAEVTESQPTPGVFVLGAAAELDIPAVPGRGTRSTTDRYEDTVPVGAATEPPGLGPSIEDEDDEARYTPQPPARRRLGRTLVGLLALILVLGAALGAGYAWTRTQYYVAAADEQVAIYQGLPVGVPGLSRVYEVQEIRLAALPVFYQDMVRAAIEVPSLAAARDTVATLQATAQRCQSNPSASPSPSTTAGPSASSSPSSPVATTPPASPAPSAPTPPSPRPTITATASSPVAQPTATEPSPTQSC